MCIAYFPILALQSVTNTISMNEKRNRAVIENISPLVSSGKHAVKRVKNEKLSIEADVFADGHDVVNSWLFYKHKSEKKWKNTPLAHIVNDRWQVDLIPEKEGMYTYYLEAWVDYALNWQHELRRKVKGGQNVEVELLDGLQYLKPLESLTGTEKKFVKDCASTFQNKKKYTEALGLAQSEELETLFRKYPFKTFSTRTNDFNLWIDRDRGGFSSWYEFFPRSSGKGDGHSTLKDAAKRLDYVKDMGFDVIYLPPIHPIGFDHRKGKNNATKSNKDDVGSPWAIGSKHGGHKDVHPDLGTVEDLKRLSEKANKLDMEIAMDFAIQCAPDHPYVKDHPQWFKWRPDGTVQYAENPPKKYQDILPINFECDDWENLWKELLSIPLFWIKQGVKIFRVDNPHTKPYRFWEWLISEIHSKHPDVIFLSEAFTRPKVMHQLAKVGFTQSYTYFTWRNDKHELSEYINELQTKSRDFFRPNFWPNTPDILPFELQQPNEASYLSRFFLAATLSSNYGMYGPVFENMVYQSVPGKEEYWNSEKYQIENHNWEIDTKLKQVIKLVNQIRREHPALQDTFNAKLCSIENDQIIAYFKANKDKGDYMLFAVNLDPYYKQGGWVEVPLNDLNIDPDTSYTVKDLVTQSSYEWKGPWNYIELNPHGLPFHCFQIIK